jgi:hypothetical protein
VTVVPDRSSRGPGDRSGPEVLAGRARSKRRLLEDAVHHLDGPDHLHVLEDAIFAVVKAIIDRGGATGFRRLTGGWPRDE